VRQRDGSTTPDNTKASSQSLINMTYFHPDTTPLEKVVAEKAEAGAYDLKLTP